MKNMITPFATCVCLSGLIALLGCSSQKESNELWYLTGPDSSAVVAEVIAAIDAWGQANVAANADMAAEFWDSSPQMRFAENGDEYADWTALRSLIREWYSQPIDSIQLTWEKREVLPLSRQTASLYGRLYFRVRFSSGEIYQARSYLTGLFILADGTWKLRQGHESYKVLPNDETESADAPR
jgi:hypothetical protein